MFRLWSHLGSYFFFLPFSWVCNIEQVFKDLLSSVWWEMKKSTDPMGLVKESKKAVLMKGLEYQPAHLKSQLSYRRWLPLHTRGGRQATLMASIYNRSSKIVPRPWDFWSGNFVLLSLRNDSERCLACLFHILLNSQRIITWENPFEQNKVGHKC